MGRWSIVEISALHVEDILTFLTSSARKLVWNQLLKVLLLARITFKHSSDDTPIREWLDYYKFLT